MTPLGGPSYMHYDQKVKKKRKKYFLAGVGFEPTSPCSRGEFVGALDHWATKLVKDLGSTLNS